MTTRRQSLVSPAPGRSLGRGVRPRLIALTSIFSACLLASHPLAAQTHKVTAPEKVTRAVSVYEWTGDLAKPTAARLVPVSLFIDGAFQDGGTFYSRPVPLALLNGNIYSLEKAGVPQGNVTLDYARHLQAATSATGGDIADLGWFGYGTYAPLPPAKKEAPLRASKTLSAVISSKDPDDKPHFSNASKDKSIEASSTTKSTAPATTTASTAPDDPDRPHFSKPPGAAPPDATPPASTTSSTPGPSSKSDTSTPATTTRSSDSGVDPDRPTLRHRDPKQAEADRKARAQSGVSAIPGALNNDPDRPTMRRGEGEGANAPPSQLSGLPATLHQSIAVSDAVTREPHPFARDWATATEHDEVQAKLRVLAQQQVVAYNRTSGAPATLPAPAALRRTAHGRTTTPAKAIPAVPGQTLTNEQLASYMLSYGGLPTFVYSAVATPPASTTSLAPPERYVTLVTQLLPSGEMQLAFASVTDAAHLDRTPWYRFIDVVDPDAGHRASLVFELRGQTSRQFALFRILSAKADQIFLSNPTE